MNYKLQAKVILFKRKEFARIPIAESLGNGYRFSSKQIDALERLTDETTDFIGYGGSAFSGKSYLECYWQLLSALAYPGTAWGLCRKELVTLKKTTIETMFKIFAENGFTEIDYNYNQQLNFIEFRNDSIIYLLETKYKPSDPLFMRFGGLELTGAAVDESAEGEGMAIDILSSRVGRCNNLRYGIRGKMLETFNPAKNHVYQRYYKPWKDGNLKPTFCFIPALPKDNPSPEAVQYIERMLATADKVTIERLIYGNFEYDDDPAKLVDYDSILDLFTNTFVKPGTGPRQKYLTADIALHGSDSFLVGAWDDYILDEVVELPVSDGKEVIETIEKLAKKHEVPQSNITFDDNGTGQFIRGFLSRAIPFVNNSRQIPVTGSENYENLKTQCAYLLAEIIRNHGMYIKAPLTSSQKEEIVKELEAQLKQFEPDNDRRLRIIPKEKVKAIIGRSPDYSDMMIMRMIFSMRRS